MNISLSIEPTGYQTGTGQFIWDGGHRIERRGHINKFFEVCRVRITKEFETRAFSRTDFFLAVKTLLLWGCE